jgi:tRNA uridine 5-carbamoylmethylation protein Kti12
MFPIQVGHKFSIIPSPKPYELINGSFGVQLKQDSTSEKELRGSLKSEVQKLVSKETLIILDSLNYIKGYRYELYCVSKLCQTPQCVVCVDTTRFLLPFFF